MFFNSGVVRERLAGLKLMPTLPGYFVGLGLLLTFVGLVIALSKAAGGVSGSPENITQYRGCAGLAARRPERAQAGCSRA